MHHNDGYDVDDSFFDNSSMDEETSNLLHTDRIENTREKQKNLSHLHNSISEANLIFKQLAQLVTKQGDSVNSIQHNAQRAADNAKLATKEIEQLHDKHVQRKRMYLKLIALTVFVFLVMFFCYFPRF